MEQKEQVGIAEKMTLNEETVYAEYVKKDITDDFIFGKVMQKPENCIGLLECLTGNKIGSVRTVISQKVVKVTNDSKGIRYDIYVEDDKDKIYDAEMQHYGRKILIFNTKGNIINVSKQIDDFLKYLEKKQAKDDFTRRLDSEVSLARQNREWMVEYMKTLVHDMDVRNEGIEIGISQGISQGISSSIIDFLSEYGQVPEALKERICGEHDVDVLKQWNKLSARVSSIEEFMDKM